MTADDVKALLNLKPLPREGGYYVETYRAAESVPRTALPPRYPAAKSLSTAIYYFLTPDTFSALHRLLTDEIYHFYVGDPVELLQLRPDGSGEVFTLGPDLLRGMRPQIVVPRGVWQGARLRPGGRFALLGTTMAPGYDAADYEPGRRDELATAYREFEDLIVSLTR
ncbi:cupin domain-containing protein [Nitrospira sp. Kam-Ns4a]